MVRLFLAIETPASEAAALLATLPRDRAVRPTPPAQVHMTLRFIGEVEDERAAKIEGALAGLARAAFALRLAGAGCFGGKGRAGAILWAGVEPSPPLLALQADIEAALTATGLAPERRRFHPHVTLARCRPGASDGLLRDWVVRQHDWRGEPFAVQRVVLMESRLHPGGAEHRCRRVFPLSQAGNPT